jgi:hypothetical protein
MLCSLEVVGKGRTRNKADFFLYSLIRVFWPIKPFEFIYSINTGKSLNFVISGCRSQIKESKQPQEQNELELVFTEGYFKGNVLLLKPGEYLFGRNPEVCNLVYPMAYNSVSKVHFSLHYDATGKILVTDKSSFSTWIGNRELKSGESAVAVVGNVIRFGNERIIITVKGRENV